MLTSPLWTLLVLFIGTTVTTWMIATGFHRRLGLRRRFRAFGTGTSSQAGRSTETHDGLRWVASVERYVDPLAALSMPEAGEEMSGLRRRLLHAGWRSPRALTTFVAARTLLALALPLLAWIVMQAWPGAAPSLAIQAAALFASAASGYLSPVVWLNRCIRRRQRAIFEAFPDALDLMLVCVESGLGLDLAIQRVAAELRTHCAPLADELELVCAEMRAGSTRERVLQRLSERVGLDEIAGFAAMLTQADRFGTSIGDALRVQADSLRTTRRLRAQEAAAKVPVKLMLPLVFCIFPAMFTVLLGPAAIRIWRVLIPALQSAG